MKRVFVIASIYQLFNAINITEYENKYDNTTLILLQTEERFTSNINITYLKTLFEKVYVANYDAQNNKISKFIYILQKSLGKKIFNLLIETQFDEVFISGTEIFSKLIACKLINNSTKLFYFEDGIASYYSVLDSKTKKKNDAILKLRFGIEPLKYCSGLYVYEPNCVYNNSYKIKLLPIPKLKNRKMNLINFRLVCKDELISFDKKVIFFNAWFENDIQYELQNRIIEVMFKYLGKENCCIKTHPNELNKMINKEDSNYITNGSSLEMSNYYCDFGDSIFISVISTASFSPKLIYEQEPCIIYLFKLFQNEFGMWKDIDSSIKNISESYSNKEKIYIPNSFEEYEKILLHFQKELKNESEVKSHNI